MIGVGLVGVGFMGKMHFGCHQESERSKVVALCDIDEKKLSGDWSAIGGNIDDPSAKNVNLKGIKTYNKIDDMLTDPAVELVDITLPTYLHAKNVLKALQAGRHVLCEKPMEASLDAATDMVRASHESGKILMVALKLRYSPQVVKAKAIVDAGTLGDIYYAETVADRRRGNPGGSFVRKATAGFGAAADIGVYALDTALYLMGHPKPVAVSGITSNYLSLHNTWNPALKETEVEVLTTAGESQNSPGYNIISTISQPTPLRALTLGCISSTSFSVYPGYESNLNSRIIAQYGLQMQDTVADTDADENTQVAGDNHK